MSGIPLTKELLKNKRHSVLHFVDIDDQDQVTIKDEVKSLIDGDEELTRYVQGIIRTIPTKDNPKLLSDFHYEYKDGKLVNMTSGEAFHWVNQYHYDALGDIIVDHIQKLMVAEGLEEILLPLDDPEGPHVNIFASKDWKTCETLTLLIQGSGAVRAGQWARALCINENLDLGTVLPYIKRCKALGWGVLVLNPNMYHGFEDIPVLRKNMLTTQKSFLNRPLGPTIKGNESRGNHITYVWDNLVQKSNSKAVLAVAHSAGGDGTVYLIQNRFDEVKEKLKAVAFTDSVHSVGRYNPPGVIQFLKKRCINWVTSNEPLDTLIREPEFDCPLVSAGHNKHEYTSGYAIDAVFAFLQKAAVAPPTPIDDTITSEEKQDSNSKKSSAIPLPLVIGAMVVVAIAVFAVAIRT